MSSLEKRIEKLERRYKKRSVLLDSIEQTYNTHLLHTKNELVDALRKALNENNTQKKLNVIIVILSTILTLTIIVFASQFFLFE